MRGFGSPRRGLFSKAVGLGQLGLMLGLGCSTEAVAIKECREIEELRCEASVSCGIVAEDEVEGCKRFYKEQCLHGIAGDKTRPPTKRISASNCWKKRSKLRLKPWMTKTWSTSTSRPARSLRLLGISLTAKYLNAESVGGGGSTQYE